MSSSEIFKIWAPQDARWTVWAKPVLFSYERSHLAPKQAELEIPSVYFRLDFHTMLVLDLPGVAGVAEALAFAKTGYCPVPLYNGVDNPQYKSLINAHAIAIALFEGIKVLSNITFRHDSPPVFMLDSERMSFRTKVPGIYDNRWCIFPQDMPSATFLQRQDIQKVVVRSDIIRSDLSSVLNRYKKSGINVQFWDVNANTIQDSPSVSLWVETDNRRPQITASLTRNVCGGFGGLVPKEKEPDDDFFITDY